jgi:hypothetical protein
LWVSRYGSVSGFSPGFSPIPNSVAISPAGVAVFVTGVSNNGDYATVAYDAATGAQLWAGRYNGPGNSSDLAYKVAVSPDGATVFVTGASNGGGSGLDYATVAYDAATGAQLWAGRYNGPGNSRDEAYSLAVSPGGATVFVTGGSHGITAGSNRYDCATVAYNAATGARRWVRRYNGPANRRDLASAVTVSPGGRSVFVTGTSTGAASGQDYATIAYNAATGARRWVRRYNGPANRRDVASAVTVSPGGRSVFVTGTSTGAASGQDYATIAYSVATGARRWVRRYNGPQNKDDLALAGVAGPAGHKMYVTGTSNGDYATVAYDAATGARRWASRYDDGARGDVATAVAVSPAGGTVYVTGRGSYFPDVGDIATFEYATVAYQAATGARRWASRYDDGARGDVATALAVSPAGDRVYVTGQSLGNHVNPDVDFATVAYEG